MSGQFPLHAPSTYLLLCELWELLLTIVSQGCLWMGCSAKAGHLHLCQHTESRYLQNRLGIFLPLPLGHREHCMRPWVWTDRDSLRVVTWESELFLWDLLVPSGLSQAPSWKSHFYHTISGCSASSPCHSEDLIFLGAVTWCHTVMFSVSTRTLEYIRNCFPFFFNFFFITMETVFPIVGSSL